MDEFITLNIQVRTDVPGSKCFRLIQVDRDSWNEMDAREKQNFVNRMALKMVSVDYAEVPD